MARGILDSLMSATYFNASALRLLRQLVIISFRKILLSKVFLKNSCSLLPGDRGSKFWPRNVSGGGRWSEGRIFYSTFPRSQVDDHCQTDQHHLHHHLGYSTVHSLQARLVSQDIHYQHHHYQWYEMIWNDITFNILSHRHRVRVEQIVLKSSPWSRFALHGAMWVFFHIGW